MCIRDRYKTYKNNSTIKKNMPLNSLLIKIQLDSERMEFMDLMKEWLRLREHENDKELFMPLESIQRNYERSAELEFEINKRIRGDL